MRAIMPAVNPKILTWARTTAGLGIEDAAQKLQLKDSKKATAAEKLVAIEAGGPLSRSLLVRMAKQYRRPLLVFYLSDIPRADKRGEDFRTLLETPPPEREAVVDALVRNIKARQSVLREALVSEGDVAPLQFIASYSLRDSATKLAETITRTLELNLQKYRTCQNQGEAFKYLRGCVERIGVFTVLAGNLGSHHTDLDTSAFRGFALSDEIAPFVVINDHDAKAAWSFTLMHEVAHLWLGVTGISGSNTEREIERFCNDAASQILLPEADLSARISPTTAASQTELVARIDQVANDTKVSSRMVAYRLLRANAISEAQFTSLSAVFFERWRMARENQRQAARETEGGPSYYTVKRFKLGSALLDTTKRMLSSGELSTTQVGAVLGVRPLKVQTIFMTDQAA
ncbi:MAG: ImmA/IrrE family metallo-endopeptidase [Candidatus Competibacteraceae bacterium]